jgi:Uma2 family endonuclease
MIVEFADSSLAKDRGEKRRAHAEAAIPVYWIINLKQRQIEVYSRPSAKKYQGVKTYKTGQVVPVMIDGNQIGQINVEDILPRSAE